MIYNAKDYGMIPGEEIGEKLNKLLAEFKNIEGEKVLNFDPGEYYIDSDSCPERKMYITNTLAEKQYKPDEKPHWQRVAFYIEGVNDLTISGEGASFIMRGRVTNAAVLKCNNITFEGIEIKAENPDLHELTVENTGLTYVDFRLDCESQYANKNGSWYFIGKDYETPFTANIGKWPYFGKISGDNTDRIVRVMQPFTMNLGIKEKEPYLFRVRYPSARKFKVGDRYCVYDVRRLNVGFFVENTKNITLRRVKQRFNVALAFVAQNSENINIEAVEFCPAEGQVKQFASYADFIQVCMCKGQVNVTDSIFAGAGDDVLNVHGTHFEIKSVEGNVIKAVFRHHESYGYLAFNPGDELEFVNSGTLLPEGKGKVKSASLEDDYTVRIELEDASEAKSGLFVENVTLCPDLYFARNKMSRIVTRGLLITTRGKVVVEDNDFNNTIMHSILFSDDARSWFESGPCKDVTIRNNRFRECDESYIQILPENSPRRNAVHGRFVIEGNTFMHDRGIDARRCEEIIFRNNIIEEKSEEFVKCKDVVKSDITY